MATVTGFTAERMLEIEGNAIVSGVVDGSGHLQLTKFNTNVVDAGVVVGATGAAGTNGTNGATGPTGPAGPTTMIGVPVQVATATADMTASGLVVGMARNNVPVVAGRTYGIKVDMAMEVANASAAARWDIWVRLNGSNLERIQVIQPAVVAVAYVHVFGEIFWIAPTTQSTDDFTVYAEQVVSGSNLGPAGASTLKRKIWVMDYGVVT